MATKVRGITIELGADTSGVAKALSGVNKEIGSTQKQLKDVERLLKLDPKNTELLEQKQKLLGNAVGQTETKLEALKRAQAQVVVEMEKTGEGQEQYDALTREIIACENELVDLKVAANEAHASMTKIGQISSTIAGATGKMAEKTRAMSATAAGLLGTIGGLAIKAGQSADDLNTLSKQTGLTTTELQKMQYAADMIDVPVDTITGSLKKLKNNMTSTSKDTKAAWEQIGVSLRDDVTGELRNIDDVFYDTLEGLGNIENETERDIIAMQLFGKSADELAGILDDGGEALRQLGEEAENKGVIISQEDLDAANEMNDAIDRLKAESAGTFAALGTEVAQMLLPYIPKIQEALERVLEVIRNIDPDRLQIAAKMLVVIAALSPLLSIFSGIFTVISALIPVFTALAAVIGAIEAPILIAIAAIAAIIAIGVALYKNWDKVKEVALDVWSKITDAIDTAKTKIGTAIEGIKAKFQTVFEGIWSIVKGIINKMLGGIENMVNGYINAINKMLGAISTVASAIGGVLGFSPVNLQLSTISLPRLAKGGTVFEGNAIVGEAGAELLSVSNGAATVTPLTNTSNNSDITGLLRQYLPYLAQDQNIYLNGKTLVGGIINDVNSQLGTISMRGSNR